ncbi:hypothetical protein BD413DRAFT_541025 [Trametes elegans]|nr:hypothetical protein BD413DRAFT_541025 [Trametes elegans]
MHCALLIDEVLQLIFDYCTALPAKEARWTLCQLARCCKAWKDPALDRLWLRMDGAGPLLNLLTFTEDEELQPSGIPPLFWTYSKRVKEASFQAARQIPSVSPPTVLMPRLEAISLSFRGCTVPEPWILSPRLKRVNVNIGFARDPQEVIDRSNAVAEYLGQIRACSPDLRSLQVRGKMTESLNGAVAALTQLKHLTVYANGFLTCDTLAVVATFPRLQSLNVHASALQHADFADALTRVSAPHFPALEELEIRTNGALLAVVLEHLPSGVLQKLHLDMDRSSRGPGYFKGIFELLAQKASHSLKELVIEDCTEYEDLDSSSRSQAPLEWYPLSLLSPLAALKQLNRFSLMSVLPPVLNDADVGALGKWWPLLQHLDLGTFDPELLPPDWQARMTPAAFAAVAKYHPCLESLSLPVMPDDMVATSDKSSVSRVPSTQQAALRSLTIGDVPDADACASALVQIILTTFPALVTLDCPSVEVTEHFAAVTGSITVEC